MVPHFGAGYFREALMLADLCPNVYLDTSSSNSWVRYEGLDLKTVFQRALESWGRRACCSAPIRRSSRAAGIPRCSKSKRGCWRRWGLARRMPG